jgi:hypothetical protein
VAEKPAVSAATRAGNHTRNMSVSRNTMFFAELDVRGNSPIFRAYIARQNLTSNFYLQNELWLNSGLREKMHELALRVVDDAF